MKSIRRPITTGACRFASGFMLLVSILGNTGCATAGAPGPETGPGPQPGAALIQPGDKADVLFICRFGTGEIVAATDKEKLQGMPVSRVFIAKEKDGPASITAAAPGSVDAKERSFEEEISTRIAEKIAGMKEGETRKFELTAQEMPARDPQNFVITIPRVRIRPKEMRMSPGDYEFRAKKAAAVGQSFAIDPAFPGRVESVTDKEVVVRFQAKAGTTIETPFGAGRVREDENNYLIDIDARKGAIVRSGPFVGRVTAVDEQNMTLDYRHPFGGETLTCNVSIEKISREKPLASAAGK